MSCLYMDVRTTHTGGSIVLFGGLGGPCGLRWSHGTPLVYRSNQASGALRSTCPQRSSCSPKQMPGLAHGRPCRVVALIITIVVLSLADLYITLMYLHSGGLGEANPVARWIIGQGSLTLL